MSRQTRKRRPKAWQRPEPEPVPETEPDWDRIRQRFACMKGRSIELHVVPYGPIVEAADPDELREKTEAIIAEATRKLPVN